MATQVAPRGRSQNRYAGGPNPSGLADVLELILDKGLVIDLYVRVSLVGIELLTIDARIVIASVDTYLRFAEAVGRMDLADSGDAKGLPDLLEGATSGAAKSKTSGALDAAKEQLSGLFDSDDDEEEEEQPQEREPARRRRRRKEEDEE
jgi:gas vesicle structural protein